jgi:N-acetylmuramidase
MTAPQMSQACKSYIRSLVQGVFLPAVQYLGELDDKELFRGLAVPARADVKEMFDKGFSGPPGISAEIPGMGAALMGPLAAALQLAAMGGNVLSRISELNYAYHVVESGKLKFAHDAKAPEPAADAWAKDYVHHCVLHHEIPLEIDEDLTDSLPAGSANAATLTDADYNRAAQTLSVDVAAVKAVGQVESAGSGFGASGRPVIRYELHRFQAKTHGHFHKTHPYLSQPSLAAGGPYHNGAQSREYTMLFNAMLLTIDGNLMIGPAIESASWGKFQIMGENWSSLGWSSALSFASDMYISEGKQLDAFVKFVQHNGLAGALKKHDWAAFARGYNGAGYAVNHYDTHMQHAFNRFNRAQPAGAHP